MVEAIGPRTAAGTQTAVSRNWGGYVYCPATDCSTPSSGHEVLGVEASWTIPSVASSASSGDEYAATWVGIGGFGTDNLVQDGTWTLVLPNGVVSIVPWWEMLPGYAQQVGLSPNPKISPGDTIFASTQYAGTSGGDQEWSFQVKDTTTNSSWSGTETCGSGCYSSSFESADWIQESPSEGGNLVQLPAYASFWFAGAQLNLSSSWVGLGSVPGAQVWQVAQNNPTYLNGYGVVPSLVYGNGSNSSFAAQYLVNAVDPWEAGSGLVMPSPQAGPGLWFDPTIEIDSLALLERSRPTNLSLSSQLISSVPGGTNCSDLVNSTALASVAAGSEYYPSPMAVCSGLTPGSYGVGVTVWYTPPERWPGQPGSLALWSSTAPHAVEVVASYGVAFDESGLPPGSTWSVNVTGAPPQSGTQGTIRTVLPAGVYNFTASSTNLAWGSRGGVFAVNSTSVTVPVRFYRHAWNVTFTEQNLPARALTRAGWVVELDGLGQTSTFAVVNFTLPNGTYPYLVRGPSGYVAEGPAPSGLLTVSGTSVNESFTFEKGRTVSLTFAEKGLPKAQPWSVDVGGWTLSSTSASIRYLDLTPGAYAYSVVAPLAGQNITQAVGSSTTYGPTGQISLGGSTTVHLTFAYRYAVTFTETGLTAGTWSISIKGHSETVAWDSPIQFDLTNGTYAYKVGAEPGSKSIGVPTRVVVPTSVTVAVTFTRKS